MFHIKYDEKRKHEEGRYFVELTKNRDLSVINCDRLGYWCDKKHLRHFLREIEKHFQDGSDITSNSSKKEDRITKELHDEFRLIIAQRLFGYEYNIPRKEFDIMIYYLVESVLKKMKGQNND